MATLEELRDLYSDDGLRKRVEVATVIAAQALLEAVPGTANGRAWALVVLQNPNLWGRVVYKSILATNAATSVAQIQGATDSAIQTAVDAVAPAFAEAYAGA